MSLQPLEDYGRILSAPDPGQAIDAHFAALHQAAVEQAQAQRVQSARSAYLADPNATTANALFTLDPSSRDAVKAGWDGLHADQQNQQLQDYSAILGHLQAGNTDIAKSLVQRHIDADSRAGHDTSGDEAMLQAIDRDAGKAAGVVQSKMLAVLGPDKYTAAFGKFGEERRADAKLPGEIDLTEAQAGQADAAAAASEATARKTGLEADAYPAQAQADLAYKKAQTAKESTTTVKDDLGRETLLSLDGQGAPGGATALRGDVTYVPPTKPSRGLQNNNYGNINALPKGQMWKGQTGTDDKGYAIFATPEDGQRAAVVNLQSYGHQGINTLSEIAARWAPKKGGNDPVAYAKGLSQSLGIPVDQPINLADSATASHVAGAMFKQEIGGHLVGQPTAAGASGTGARVLYQAPENKGDALSPDAVEAVAQQYVATGQLPPLGMGRAATVNRNIVLNRAAAIQTETGTTGTDAVARHGLIKGQVKSLAQLTSVSNLVAASEDAINSNLAYVLSLAPKAADPTGSPILNQPIQMLRKQVWGSPQVAQFDTAIGTVADEYAKAMTTNTGSGGAPTSDGARKEAYARLSKASTLAQLKAVGAAMQTEVANRHAGYTKQIDRVSQAIRNGGVMSATGASAPPAGGGGAVRVRTLQEAQKLAPGTSFIGPDGKGYTR